MNTEKKELVLTADDVKAFSPLAGNMFKQMLDYFALLADPHADHDGVLAEFVQYRANNTSILRDMKERISQAELFAKLGNKFLKEVYSYAPEELPDNVKWGKQSFTESFENPQAAVFKLIASEGTPMENFVCWVTPKQAAEAAGITMDRLKATLGDMIVSKPKEPTLYIK